MIRWSSSLVLVISVFVLAACGSSPPVRYFGLQSIQIDYQRDPDGAPFLAIGQLRVADYLKRTQMVSRGRGAEVIIDDFNRWAEPLDGAIHSTIAANVDSLLGDVMVIAFPYSPMIDITYRLVGRINRFDVNASGLTVLDIQWGIGNPDGKILVPARRQRYTSRAEISDDPAAMALAMSDAIEQLSRDIATEMEALAR